MIKVISPLLYGVGFIILAFFCEWIYRKTIARVQRRYGPLIGFIGLLQPYADFIKLLGKEDLSRGNPVFDYTPIFLVSVALISIFILPFHSIFLGFQGDFLILIGLFDLYVVLIFLLGVYSRNKFGLIGSMREAILFFSYEASFILSILGFMVFSNATSLTGLKGFSPILLIPGAVFFVSSMAKLGKLPFDISTAKQELISGYSTDLSGRKLALLRLAEDLELLFVSVLGAALLFGPSVWNLAQAIPIVILISLVAAFFPRYRLDQASEWFVRYPLPLAIIGVFICSL